MNAALPFTVGWEFEFALRDPAHLARVDRTMRVEGFDVVNFGRYRHSPASSEQWDLKTDSSCGIVPGAIGYEAVSPVIGTYPDLVRHARAGTAIKLSGGVINRRCGLHVHLGFSDHYNAENVDLLFRFLTRYQSAFFLLVPQSRRSNQFCKPFSQEVVEAIKAQIKRDRIQLPEVWRDKNTWVNFQTLGRIGTIEFRLMPGTLDSEFIVGYVMFLQHLMETIIRGKKSVQWGAGSARDNEMLFLTMLQQAGFYGQAAKIDEDRAVLGRKWAKSQFAKSESETPDAEPQITEQQWWNLGGQAAGANFASAPTPRPERVVSIEERRRRRTLEAVRQVEVDSRAERARRALGRSAPRRPARPAPALPTAPAPEVVTPPPSQPAPPEIRGPFTRADFSAPEVGQPPATAGPVFNIWEQEQVPPDSD